jgi:hypothetical protein
LVKRCNFQKFPREYGDLDEQKGVEFLEGKWGGITIERLAIYRNGIMLDTRSSTADSEKILGEALVWTAKEFGITYRPGMFKRKGYVSNLTFYSGVPLLSGLNRALTKLANRVGEATSQIVGENFSYEPIGISVQYDLIPMRQPVAPFTIQRRIETPFSENKYFSEAPLPTELHLTLLQEFENDLVGTFPRAVEAEPTR